MVRGTHDCFQKPNYYPGQNVREVNLCISALKLPRNKKKRHISLVTGMRSGILHREYRHQENDKKLSLTTYAITPRNWIALCILLETQ